jgi:hypothetical protein
VYVENIKALTPLANQRAESADIHRWQLRERLDDALLLLSEYFAISHCFKFTLTNTTPDNSRFTNNLACLEYTQSSLAAITSHYHNTLPQPQP